MYELLSSIDFTKKRNNFEKDRLKRLFINWLSNNYPNVNTVDTYFTDSIFIGNNPWIGLNIIDVLTDGDEGRVRYHSALVEHFEGKGYDLKTSHSKAREYLTRFDHLKEFLDDYETKNMQDNE
ncbi:hypothetical protein HNQ56_000807 [Anaerotaenia torta]|uniref:hypothetical protein n=1 Tax=Anaerotaenia torta TaxID=433293 RepID=UPI003D1D0A40